MLLLVQLIGNSQWFFFFFLVVTVITYVRLPSVLEAPQKALEEIKYF